MVLEKISLKPWKDGCKKSVFVRCNRRTYVLNRKKKNTKNYKLILQINAYNLSDFSLILRSSMHARFNSSGTQIVGLRKRLPPGKLFIIL